MTDFVPLRKQSKKKQREFYSAKRGSWNGLNPITRVAPNSKAYDRNKTKRESKFSSDVEDYY